MAPIPKSAPVPAPLAVAPPTPRPVFPLSALGPRIEAAASAAAERTQAPPELIAHHLLTLAAMPAQRLISVRLPTGLVQPVSSYFLTLVGSGEGRSAAETLCVAPVRFWEKRFTASVGHVDEKGRAMILREFSINLGRIEDGPEGEEKVINLDHYVPDPSYVPGKAAAPFEFDHVFLSLFRSGINDRYDRYARFGRRSGLFAGIAADLLTPSCARRNEADSLSALWDGRVVATGVEGASLAPRLSVHLVATVGEGLALLRAPEVKDSGLLGRLLSVQPASRIGARSFSESDGAPPPELHALHALLTELYAREATTETRIVVLDDKAKDAWFAFAHECEAAMAPDGPFASIRPLAGHLAEHALRLAAVVALIEDDTLKEIGADALARGIALARFYAAEALRLTDLREPQREEKDPVAALLSWLERKHAGQELGLRAIYSFGPPVIRSYAAALRAMRQLEKLGFVEVLAGEPDGGPRWRITAGVQRTAA